MQTQLVHGGIRLKVGAIGLLREGLQGINRSRGLADDFVVVCGQ